jgi:hypothetical protein
VNPDAFAGRRRRARSGAPYLTPRLRRGRFLPG